MLAFKMSSTVEVIRDLADRMKRRRIEHELTQRELASRSNVSYGSLRLFERSGKISLESLVKIAFALEAEAEFERLFPGRPLQNIDDVIDRPLKQRVRRQSGPRAVGTMENMSDALLDEFEVAVDAYVETEESV